MVQVFLIQADQIIRDEEGRIDKTITLNSLPIEWTNQKYRRYRSVREMQLGKRAMKEEYKNANLCEIELFFGFEPTKTK